MSLFRSILQNITTSTNNSTEDNLASGNTFTGTYDETLGINGIQVYHASDQDCTIYIDQSIENTFADLTQVVTDSFFCIANSACTRTFISVAPFYRLRVTNNGASATTKLSTYTGMTPIISPLPRKLSPLGNLQVVASLRGDQNTERHVWVNPTSELNISPVFRMVGTTFDGTDKDPNFWTDGSLRDATVTQDGGEIELETNTTANGYAKYTSVRKARFVAGSAQLFSASVNWVTAGTTDNVRRVGSYTTTGDTGDNVVDGFFFQLDGTTFSVGTRRGGGTTVLVSSGSFNGNYGPIWAPEADTYYKIEIEFAPRGAFWYINGTLLHKTVSAHQSNTNTLPITFENENTNDITTNVVFDCIGAYIARQGELLTNPTYKHISTATTTVCKYGAGVLHKIAINDPTNICTVTIYDNTAASGTIIGIMNITSKVITPWVMSYDLPFSTGLTIVTSAINDFTIIYE